MVSRDLRTYSLFMCQDKDKNEDENHSFGLFWIFCMTNEPILLYASYY